jgi:hypothetical protein
VIIAALPVVAAGCATTRYTSPAAARPVDGRDPNAGQAQPSSTPAVFQNRTVSIRVLDNRRDRPQSAVLIDEVRAALGRFVEEGKGGVGAGAGAKAPAVFEVRILRYAAEGQLSKWRACVGFGVTVEIGPVRRHELASERCSTVANVWGTASADEALRAAFREAMGDLETQLDGLPAVAADP